jgi:hypothetical protein
VTCIIDSEEREVIVSFNFSVGLTTCFIDRPFLILLGIKVSLVIPYYGLGPSFTTSPVTHEVFVTAVDQDRHAFIQKIF